MKPSNKVVRLVLVVMVLSAIAAGTGLFYQDGGSVYAVTSLRGQTVQMYGQGLYRYDTFLIGAGNRGTDAAILAFELPLLALALVLYRRGALRGGLLLAGSLGCFLYYYGSMSVCTAYNNLFLVYAAIFSASLFAFILTLASFDLNTLARHVSPRLPYRGMSLYLYAVAAVLLIVWLGLSLLPAMLEGRAPNEVAIYTTTATYALDLGVIVPAVIIAAVLLRRRTPLGYLLAATMTLLNVTIGVLLLGQGAAQLLAGVPLPIGAIVGFMASFAILTFVAILFSIVLLRNIKPEGTAAAALAAASRSVRSVFLPMMAADTECWIIGGKE